MLLDVYTCICEQCDQKKCIVLKQANQLQSEESEESEEEYDYCWASSDELTSESETSEGVFSSDNNDDDDDDDDDGNCSTGFVPSSIDPLLVSSFECFFEGYICV
jgi:hypothetical protein